MAIEPRRGCGFRKVGGIYLVTDGPGVVCDRLPILLSVCPTCGHGIKQARGWTWVDVAALVGGVHRNCTDEFACPLCMDTGRLGRAGLLWIGERFYKTPAHFMHEVDRLGVSRRIATVPRDYVAGETWVLFAHPKVYACEKCRGAGWTMLEGDSEPCEVCGGSGNRPGIFYVVKPKRLEVIVTASQSQDAEYMESLTKRGLVPVVVPDDDRDHQGTVYDRDEETEE